MDEMKRVLASGNVCSVNDDCLLHITSSPPAIGICILHSAQHHDPSIKAKLEVSVFKTSSCKNPSQARSDMVVSTIEMMKSDEQHSPH
jgi:hypothetical protein